MIQQLVPGDEARVEAFLCEHAATSMFLRSNLRNSGLEDAPRPYHGVWMAQIEDGALVGVVMHGWSGSLLVQAPRGPILLARAALEASGRPLKAMSGPWAQVSAVRDAFPQLGKPAMNSCEDLFDLDLRDLRVPAALAEGRWRCRLGEPGDVDTLAGWRHDYCVEALHDRPGPELVEACRKTVERGTTDGTLFVLVEDGALVSMSGFNARLPDCVQIGGVWTPKALRGRGYGRGVVAGSLLAAREAGVERSILFTDQANEPARRAYQGLGYRIIGDFGIVLYPS